MFAPMAQRKTLLIVDDDTDLRGAVAEQLETEGFATVQAGTAGEGVELAKSSRPDLILLDVDLPDFDGREACRRMRGAGVAAPVIMLTGAVADEDAIQGLESGANDYVTKPYRFAVLLARIRAQLRSHEHSEGAVFRLGAYEFRPAAKLLVDDHQKKIRLTEKETNILKYLYRAGEKPVSREELSGRGLGLQRRRHHPHPGNPRLSPAPEDRARPRQRAAADHRSRRLPAAALKHQIGRHRGMVAGAFPAARVVVDAGGGRA
jgi:DNA-binding response OmpR family regulator